MNITSSSVCMFGMAGLLCEGEGSTLLRRGAPLTRRQPHRGGAAGPALRGGVRTAVLERERAAVRLGDLPREREADARALGLRGEERHEQVRRVGEARALVRDAQLE